MVRLARRRPWSWVLVAALTVGGAATWLALRGREAKYVGGEGEEGLVDTLGRALPADRPAVRFVDATADAGLTFRHFPSTRTNRLPEDMGSGVALGDVDGDGWTDVFLVNTARAFDEPASLSAPERRCALFHNQGDGRFVDVSRASGADLELSGLGAAFLDADSDGDLDLLVTSYGALVYLENDGAGSFRDRTDDVGLSGLAGFWTGLAVGDYDRDGRVDVYVCGYVQYSDDIGATSGLARQFGLSVPARLNPSTFAPERNLLLHNLGGRFEECAERASVADREGRSLGAVFADLSGDGWLDLYVANDVSASVLFVNRRDGTFEDRSNDAMVSEYRGAMGLAVGDFDGDLDPDFTITHWLGQENALFVNHSRPPTDAQPFGQPMFLDSADRFGLGAATLRDVGWATRFFDFDNDGHRDLFVVNGSTLPLADAPTRLAPQKSGLFWNGGGERGFFSLGTAAGEFFGEEHVGRGGATFDYDLDGDEDLLITVHGDRPRLLRNDGGDARGSVLLRLRQPAGNRFALGSVVRVEAGGRTSRDWTDTQGSYLSQHAVGEVAFGLGAATSAERIAVTWPDGVEEELRDVPAGSLVEWERGSAPRVEPLFGRARRAEPKTADAKRRFFALLDNASKQRLADDFETALASYARALELWPGHADGLYYSGHCLSELGRDAESLATFERMARIHPGESRAWMQIGVAHLARAPADPSVLEIAERAFERAHRINGEESLPVVRLGVVALLRGELDRADDLLARAAVLNAQSVEARYFQGRSAWLRGDGATAAKRLTEARELAGKVASAAQAKLDEGGTHSGKALTARARRAESILWRWQTVLARDGDPEREYGATNDASAGTNTR
ncbi:MAG: VCBS repeat-containing protein [Planctomycetes bacterium]|nr:VCBS repeat-containing protein [Planctomycetota bacterium]